MPVWRKVRLALLVLAGAVYVALGYVASSSSHPPVVAVAVGAIPVMFALLGVCWRSPFRYPATVLCLAAFAVAALHADVVIRHAAWIYFFQHAGTMVALGIMFGSTLGSHEGALCSRIAVMAIPEPLDARYLRYTWQVTLAWAIYFGASAVLSVLLFFGASLKVWSAFAAVVTPISVPLMFGAEFLIRQRALPGRPHFSIAQTVRSYREFTQRQAASNS